MLLQIVYSHFVKETFSKQSFYSANKVFCPLEFLYGGDFFRWLFFPVGILPGEDFVREVFVRGNCPRGFYLKSIKISISSRFQITCFSTLFLSHFSLISVLLFLSNFTSFFGVSCSLVCYFRKVKNFNSNLKSICYQRILLLDRLNLNARKNNFKYNLYVRMAVKKILKIMVHSVYIVNAVNVLTHINIKKDIQKTRVKKTDFTFYNNKFMYSRNN